MVSIVDDDPSVVKSLHRTVASAGWEVISYTSGPAFLEAYDPKQPGCVLLDIRVPSTSGLTIYDKIRGSGSLTCVIFMTGYADVRTAVRMMKAGAFGFLEKPFPSTELLERIEKAVEHDAALRHLWLGRYLLWRLHNDRCQRPLAYGDSSERTECLTAKAVKVTERASKRRKR